MARRRQLLGMIAAENNRLSSAAKPVAKRIKAHIRWLEKELSRTERDLEAAIESSPALSENEALLRSVPGVGPVLARTLLAGVPELGTLTHKRVAALVGVAPLKRDSGTLRGHRSVWGGPTSELCAVHGCPGGRTPQPGSEGILRASFGGRQTQEGCLGGLHAQAALDPQRCPQTPNSLEISSLPFYLTSKTVASSCPY